MKSLTLFILSCSFLMANGLTAQQPTKHQMKGCTCNNCKCTPQSHCGCKGNVETETNCSNCERHYLSNASFHHGNSQEHDNENDENVF